jgi:hypothetical protein
MDATLAVPGRAAARARLRGGGHTLARILGLGRGDRVRYDRRSGRSASIQRALAIRRSRRSAARAAAAVRDMLRRLPTLVVYRMTGDADSRRGCASSARGTPRARSACTHAARRDGRIAARAKWRRISALHALVYARPPRSTRCCARRSPTRIADVASAAASVLQRIGDERAAEILIGGLRASRLPASRIAARLEPILDPASTTCCRPLPHEARARRRATGRKRCSAQAITNHGGLVESIVPLVDDADAPPERQAALPHDSAAPAVSPTSWRARATLAASPDAPAARTCAARALHALAQACERSPRPTRRPVGTRGDDPRRRSPIATGRCVQQRRTALARLGPG